MITNISSQTTSFRHVPVDPRFNGPGVAVEITSRAGRHLAIALERPMDGLCAFLDRLHPGEDARVATRRAGERVFGQGKVIQEIEAFRAICHPDAATGAREAFASAGISGTMRQALDLMREHGVPTFPDWFRYGRYNSGKGLWDFVLLSLTHPVLYALGKEGGRFLTGLSHGESLDSVIRSSWPGIGKAHIRNLARDTCPFDPALKGRDDETLVRTVDVAASAMFALPSEWMPKSRGEWEAFAILSDTADYFVDECGLDATTLLAPGRGTWKAYLARVSSSSGLRAPRDGGPFDYNLMGNLRATADEAYDPVRHLANTLVMPLLGKALRKASVDTLREIGERVAARWIYGDKSLNEVMRTSARWHAAQHAIDFEVTGSVGDAQWPPLIPDQDLGNGVRAVVIADRRSLVAEGSQRADVNGVPGLNHCVATYLPRVLRGASHIVSIRQCLPDRGYRRLATAELAFSRDGSRIVVEQARGHANAEPGRIAVEALDRLVNDVNGGRIPMDARIMHARKMSEDDECDETLRDACGYDWKDQREIERAARAWSRLLPRGVRTMDAKALRLKAVADMPAKK